MRNRVESSASEAQPLTHVDRFPIPRPETRSSSGMEPALVERVGESTRRYTVRKPGGGSGTPGKSKRDGRLAFEDFGKDRNPVEFLSHVFHSYFLPDGFPDSVAPSYAPYMRWRAVMYFFGGAMSVFTTRSLLHSLGIAKGVKAASGALAVNWVLKDGAGRLGKMVFASQGKKFDADLKQMRLTSSMLMGLGAGLELSTVAAPGFFLPLACMANVLKNVGAVTNTSTRAPIYKVFARKENLGDVTAKGESISNLADLLGTGFGILLGRRNPNMHAAFLGLSLGYVVASYNEIRSVELPTLNRSRFSVAVKKFLESGSVPCVPEVSRFERIITPPWATERPFEIGVRLADAFESWEDLEAARKHCEGEKFLVSFRPSERKAYVVLREGATAKDVLKGAFRAQLLVHLLKGRRMAETLSELSTAAAAAAAAPAPALAPATAAAAPLLGALATRETGLGEKQESARLGSEARDAGASAGAVGCSRASPVGAARDCSLAPGTASAGLSTTRSCREILQRHHLGYREEVEEWDVAAAEAPLATLRHNWQTGWLRRNARERARQHALTSADVGCVLAASRQCSDELFEDFAKKATAEGWIMTESLLNPGPARLLSK